MRKTVHTHFNMLGTTEDHRKLNEATDIQSLFQLRSIVKYDICKVPLLHDIYMIIIFLTRGFPSDR